MWWRRLKLFARAFPLVLTGLITTMVDTPADAATATSSIAINATVLAECDVTATSLAFGNYASTQLDGTATVNVTCTNSTPYSVALDAGGGSGASVTVRKMTGPSSALLNYALYRDAARTQIWGVTVGTDVSTGTGTGNQQQLTVYGRIPGNQHPTPGAYTDTVNVTLTY